MIYQQRERYTPTTPKHIETTTVPQLDDTGLGNLIDSELRAQSQDIAKLEKSILDFHEIEDEVLGKKFDNIEQKSTYDDVLKKHGLTVDDLDKADLRDPYSVRSLQRKVKQVQSDPRVANIEREKALAESFLKAYSTGKIKFGNRNLQAKWLRDFERYRNGEISAADLFPEDYKYVEYDKRIDQTLSRLLVQTNAEFMAAPDKTKYVQTTRQRTKEQIEGAITAMLDTPSFRNSLEADGIVDADGNLTEKGNEFVQGRINMFVSYQETISNVKYQESPSKKSNSSGGPKDESVFSGDSSGDAKAGNKLLIQHYGMDLEGNAEEAIKLADAMKGAKFKEEGVENYLVDRYMREVGTIPASVVKQVGQNKRKEVLDDYAEEIKDDKVKVGEPVADGNGNLTIKVEGKKFTGGWKQIDLVEVSSEEVAKSKEMRKAATGHYKKTKPAAKPATQGNNPLDKLF
jgi:hypothetical protein